MMPPEFLCHLPFLRMEADSAQPLEPIGRLEPLPYEDWLLLEDPAMAEQERRYRNVAPIFVRVELPDGAVPGELDDAQERVIGKVIERAHTALLLALPWRSVTAPSLSCAYVVWRELPCDVPDERGWFGPHTAEPVMAADDEGIQLGRITVWLQQRVAADGRPEQWIVQRRFGPAQREWLFSSDPSDSHALSAQDLQKFARHYGRLGQADWGQRRAAAVRCADVLKLMAMPGVPVDEQTVLVVAALENLVNSGADRPLGDTFARRCAAWFAENPEELARDTPRFRQLYAARSDILHGGDPSEALQALADATANADIRALQGWLYKHTWLAVDWLVVWYAQHPDDDGAAAVFGKTLAELANAPAGQWAARRAQLVEGRTYGRS
jgi:hypothetical protein